MDAGTIVALVLGSVGFLWGAGTYAVNRRDSKERDERDRAADREKRWLQEKRLIYVRAQGALRDLLGALANVVMYDVSEDGSADRQAALDAAWRQVRGVQAEVEMLAPDVVRDAIRTAISEIGRASYGCLVREPSVAPADEGDLFDNAEWECHEALEAMRADLGVEPVSGQYRPRALVPIPGGNSESPQRADLQE